MRKKQPVPFSERFPKADPAALKLLQRLLAFDPKDRPTAEEASICTIEFKILFFISTPNHHFLKDT
jgi:serine/threonine protein kinase